MPYSFRSSRKYHPPSPLVALPSFSTSFPLTENPISEGGAWTNQGGSNWTAVRTTPGKAFGTQGNSGLYDDSYARLVQPFGPDVDIRATMVVGSCSGFMETELLLRVTDSPGSVKLYECNFAWSGQYNEIIRWKGPRGSTLSDFEWLSTGNPTAAYSTGDQVRATIIGNIVTTYRRPSGNGAWSQIASADITAGAEVYLTGQPGLGYYEEGGTSMDNYCFSQWSVVGL